MSCPVLDLFSIPAKVLHLALILLVSHWTCPGKYNACLLLGSEMSSSPPDDDAVGVCLDGCYLLVSWSSLLTLLSKCQREGCSDQVLPCNMIVSKNGITNNVLYFCNRYCLNLNLISKQPQVREGVTKKNPKNLREIPNLIGPLPPPR